MDRSRSFGTNYIPAVSGPDIYILPYTVTGNYDMIYILFLTYAFLIYGTYDCTLDAEDGGDLDVL